MDIEYNIMEKMRDPELLKALGVGEKILGSLIVMLIGMATCIIVLYLITLVIKLLKFVSTSPQPQTAGGSPGSPQMVHSEPQEVRTVQYSQTAAESAPLASAGAIIVTSPMPGTVLSINTVPGASVKEREVLMTLEAMKMENEILAPADGVISQVAVTVGTSVGTGDVLIVM